jgi:hypothetical protein
LADDVGPNAGFVVLIAHGQYDAAAVSAAVRKLGAGEGAENAGGGPAKLAPKQVAGVEVLTPADGNDGVGFAFPSDERAMVFGGASLEKLPFAEVFGAIAKPAPADPVKAHVLLGGPEFKALFAEVDKGGDAAKLWLACRVSNSYAAAPVINAFDAITLIGVQEKDELKLRVNGAGKDALKVKDAVATVNGGLDMARGQMGEAVKQMPQLKPVADLIGSLKCEATDTTATMTGTYKGEAAALFALPMTFMGVPMAGPPPQVQPQPAVKP